MRREEEFVEEFMRNNPSKLQAKFEKLMGKEQG